MNLRSIKITVCNRRRNRDAHRLHAIKTYQFNWTDALCANNLTKHRNKFFNIIHACSQYYRRRLCCRYGWYEFGQCFVYRHFTFTFKFTTRIRLQSTKTIMHCTHRATSCFRIDLLSFSTRSIVNEFSNGFTSSPSVLKTLQ